MNARLHARLGSTPSPARVAAGVPTGGQFAATARAESGVSLGSVPVSHTNPEPEPTLVPVRVETLSPGLTTWVRGWDGEKARMIVASGARIDERHGTATVILSDPETGFQSEWDFEAGESIEVEKTAETSLCPRCGGAYTGMVCRTDACS